MLTNKGLGSDGSPDANITEQNMKDARKMMEGMIDLVKQIIDIDEKFSEDFQNTLAEVSKFVPEFDAFQNHDKIEISLATESAIDEKPTPATNPAPDANPTPEENPKPA